MTTRISTSEENESPPKHNKRIKLESDFEEYDIKVEVIEHDDPLISYNYDSLRTITDAPLAESTNHVIKVEVIEHDDPLISDNYYSLPTTADAPLAESTNHVIKAEPVEHDDPLISDNYYSLPTTADAPLAESTNYVKHCEKELKLLNLGFSASQETNPVTVSELQQLKLSSLSLHEKVAIKTRGRHSPDIEISQPGISHNKKYIRNFNSEWYQKKSWLCGCELRHALFCFPCLLFGIRADPTWTKDGFRNINRMKEKTEKHERTKEHIENMVSLAFLGGVHIKDNQNEAYRLSVNEHNKKVTNNRDILSKIIDCITFCGKFGIPLNEHNEKDDSINPGVFRGLLDFASKLDPNLKNHLETSTVFTDVPRTITNEILDCLLQVYHDEIKNEIKATSFVAVIADDTSDVSEHTEMVIVLRYVLNEEIHERLWGFFIPENQSAEGISKCIQEQLHIILEGNEQKLIAQTFDGENVMKGKKRIVQAKIKAVYSNSHFIHCYAHKLNMIMKNAASVTRDSSIFFCNVLAIQTFFSRSPQCIYILYKHMNVSIPRPSSKRLNFDVRTVNKVHENLQPLKSFFAEIQSTSNTDRTIYEATEILYHLNSENFTFWLELFNQIEPHVELIYNQMHSREIDTFKVQEYIENFKRAILEIRSSRYCENPSKTLPIEAKEVCDWICVDIAERYSFTKQLDAAKLLQKESFTSFDYKLPVNEIRLATEAYPMIDKGRLETELKVFYSRSDIHEYCRLIDLLKFFMETELDVVLSEITKLIKILLTIPLTTSEPERCFSTLKGIRTFLSGINNQERLNALAMLSTEKHFFNSHPSIKEKVIDLFAQNETRRIDFSFK